MNIFIIIFFITIIIIFLLIFFTVMGYVHLPSVGYSEHGTGALDDPIANRWKPTKGFRFTHLIREKLDKLKMDVVI